MSAFGESFRDSYDPYDAGPGRFPADQFQGDQFQGDRFQGDQFRGDRFRGDRFQGDRIEDGQFQGDQFHGDQFPIGDYRGGGFPDGFEPLGRRHRRGSGMIVTAAIGMVALIVVGAIAFAGSLLMARTSTSAPQSSKVAGAASSDDPSDLAGAIPSDSGAPSSDPAGNATTTAAPGPGRTASAAPSQLAPPSARPRSTTAQAGGNTAYEAQVLQIVNTERAKAGCRPLAYNAKLRAAAYKHSADMAARDYFSHDTPEGVSFATRITNEGYRWSAAAENIAKGQRTPDDVMRAWMNSPGHRANILNCNLKDLGVGLAYEGRTAVWTQDFGTPM